jgi:hypothetical protein
MTKTILSNVMNIRSILAATALALGVATSAHAGDTPSDGYEMPTFDSKVIGFRILNRGIVGGEAVAASEAEGHETDTYSVVEKQDSLSLWGNGQIATEGCDTDACKDVHVEAGSASNLLITGASGAAANGEGSSYAGTANVLRGFSDTVTSVGFDFGSE